MTLIQTSTETSSFFKPLQPIPDEEDLALHRLNSVPALVTRRLRELVPLLDFVDCRIDYIGADRTALSMPLLESAMNQNGTQQASVFCLIADYALGVGMFGALPGIYVAGFPQLLTKDKGPRRRRATNRARRSPCGSRLGVAVGGSPVVQEGDRG